MKIAAPWSFLSARLFTCDTDAILKTHWLPRAALLMSLFFYLLVHHNILISTTLPLYSTSYTLHLGGHCIVTPKSVITTRRTFLAKWIDRSFLPLLVNTPQWQSLLTWLAPSWNSFWESINSCHFFFFLIFSSLPLLAINIVYCEKYTSLPAS